MLIPRDTAGTSMSAHCTPIPTYYHPSILSLTVLYTIPWSIYYGIMGSIQVDVGITGVRGYLYRGVSRGYYTGSVLGSIG